MTNKNQEEKLSRLLFMRSEFYRKSTTTQGTLLCYTYVCVRLSRRLVKMGECNF